MKMSRNDPHRNQAPGIERQYNYGDILYSQTSLTCGATWLEQMNSNVPSAHAPRLGVVNGLGWCALMNCTTS